MLLSAQGIPRRWLRATVLRHAWLAGLIASLCASAAAAQVNAPACIGTQLHIEGEITSRWADALERVCQALSSRTDLDRSAYVRVIAIAHDQLLIAIRLADGRATERRVRTPDELAFTIEALVVLPRWPAP